MKVADVFKDLKGFIWDVIMEIGPEDYLEPVYGILKTETSLGPMTDIEKALFTIQDDLLEELIFVFNLDDESDDKVFDFCNWCMTASKKDFESRCYLEKNDIETALELRSQYFAACEFLQLVTAQRLDINLDCFLICYRKGFLVAVGEISSFDANSN